MPLTITTILCDSYSYYSSFTDEETEAQESKAAYPSAGLGIEARLHGYRVSSFNHSAIKFASVFYLLCCYCCPNFSPLPHSTWYHLPSSDPSLSSCLWVMHISYLASPLSILFLTFSCLFCTYQLCFLVPAHFLPVSPSPSQLITCLLYTSDAADETSTV